MKRASRALALLLLPSLVVVQAADGLSQRGSVKEGEGCPALPASAHTVAEAERAFARRSTEIGWREAFLEFFAEDAVSYAPDPGRARERLLKRPPTPQPQKVILDWWPVFADISESRDMGLTTGPSVAYENTPERKEVYHGYYFSVWKRQPDGAWRVAIDIGVETPPPPAADARTSQLRVAPANEWRPGARVLADAMREFRALYAHEQAEATRLVTAPDVSKAYARLAREDVRMHRQGRLPLEGRSKVTAHLAASARRLAWQPDDGEVSLAGDFGYTYGAYTLTPKGAKDAPVERGHYLHVWRRDPKGRWQLTADVMHPAK